jgi:hypothetical protein
MIDVFCVTKETLANEVDSCKLVVLGKPSQEDAQVEMI